MTAHVHDQVTDYVYEPLDVAGRVHFRLLDLLPGVYTDEIHCSLAPASLNDSIPFQSLSYAWGSVERPNYIFVDGQKLAVTASLHVALLRLREASLPRKLWIDAVCIDQKNHIERSQQVQILRAIYANATEVLVWLGEEDELSKLAFDIIERFAAYVAPVNRQETGLSFIELVQPLMQHSLPDGSPESAPELFALGKLLQRSWFTRVWTIQEVITAAHARIVCGSYITDWDHLASITRYISDSSLTLFLGVLDSVPGINFVPFVQRYRYAVGPIDRPGLVLLDLLMRAMSSYATDPRDMVFALMGIVELNYFVGTGGNSSIPSPYSSIKIDYTLSCAQVYTSVATYLLSEAQELGILSCAGAKMHGSNLGLPSWIPDWSFQDMEYITPCLSLVQHFHAAVESKPTISISTDSRTLTTEGILISAITHIGAPNRAIIVSGENPGSPAIQRRDFQQRLEFIEECDSIIRGDSPNSTDLRVDYWRILICNTTKDFTTPPAEYADGYTMFRHTLANFDAVYDGVDSEAGRLMIQIVQTPLYQRYLQSFQLWTRGRLLFSAQDGGVGWAPRGAEVGDLVCLLKGSSVPFILRRIGERFILVGEAYFHPCMLGEFMGKGELEWAKIQIS